MSKYLSGGFEVHALAEVDYKIVWQMANLHLKI